MRRTGTQVILVLTLAVAAAQPAATRECSNLPEDLIGTGRDIKPTADDVRRVITADFDQDGDIDVLAAACTDNTVSWFENEGGTPPGFTEVIVDGIGACPGDVAVGDIDGDGINDVVAALYTDNTVAWYKFSGSFPYTFTKNVLTNGATGAWPVAVGDLDGDGDQDIVFGAYDGDILGYFENMGGATEFSEHVISSTIDAPFDIETADVDNDGDVDILAASYVDGVAAWYENIGGSPLTFRQRTIVTTNTATDIDSVDFDHDGDLDILVSSFGLGVAWFESDGGAPPVFTQHLIAQPTNPQSLAAVDLDNDNDYDIVTFSEYGSSNDDFTLIWYENDGTNLVFTSFSIANFEAFSTNSDYAFVATGDFDGDGDQDFVMTSRLNDLIRWYENDCTPRTGPTAAPAASPSHCPTMLPVEAPTPSPTSMPSAMPTTSMMPTIPPTSSTPTMTPLPTIFPTPAPTGFSACDDGAANEILAFCQAYIANRGI